MFALIVIYFDIVLFPSEIKIGIMWSKSNLVQLQFVNLSPCCIHVGVYFKMCQYNMTSLLNVLMSTIEVKHSTKKDTNEI